MKRLIAFIIIWALGASLAFAQTPVVTQPYNVTTQNYSSTIAATNTFQSIWAANTTSRGRAGCLIQNNGSSSMYVYFGAIASATTPHSFQLSSGQSVRCDNSGITLQDQVSITGTISQSFYAGQQ